MSQRRRSMSARGKHAGGTRQCRNEHQSRNRAHDFRQKTRE
jgi:hypothetical protein